MKATIHVTLKKMPLEEAQRLLTTLCEGLLSSGSIEDYRFEIETENGVITERCILLEGGIVA